MATMTDGLYRISLIHSLFLTGAAGTPIASIMSITLLPSDETNAETNAQQRWEIRRTEGGDYTIRHANTGQYASYDTDPSLPFRAVRLSTQQCTWTIADGPEENTVTLGAPGTDLTLGLSPLAVYPPLVALSPRYEQDRGWTLHPA